jgi:hypothetical protein
MSVFMLVARAKRCKRTKMISFFRWGLRGIIVTASLHDYVIASWPWRLVMPVRDTEKRSAWIPI